MDAVIFDVDGTLCNVSSIRHYLRGDQRDFESFHRESVNCPPNEWVAQLARDMNEYYAIIVVTARKNRWFNPTWWWLNENGVPYDELFMRDDRDQRKDYVVKQEILNRIVKRYNPILAVDDNPNVIELWEQNDIPTIIVPGWEYE